MTCANRSRQLPEETRSNHESKTISPGRTAGAARERTGQGGEHSLDWSPKWGAMSAARPSRNRNGVRPSSGAAMSASRKAWEISDALVCANAAAPEDGRTPMPSGVQVNGKARVHLDRTAGRYR